MLFVLHDARDALDALHHFGIGGLHQLGDEPGQLVKIWILHAAMRALRIARRMILRST